MMEIYKKLHERINSYSIGFPASKSGAELTILELLFTRDEADVATWIEPPGEVQGAGRSIV